MNSKPKGARTEQDRAPDDGGKNGDTTAPVAPWTVMRETNGTREWAIGRSAPMVWFDTQGDARVAAELLNVAGEREANEIAQSEP